MLEHVYILEFGFCLRGAGLFSKLGISGSNSILIVAFVHLRDSHYEVVRAACILKMFVIVLV